MVPLASLQDRAAAVADAGHPGPRQLDGAGRRGGAAGAGHAAPPARAGCRAGRRGTVRGPRRGGRAPCHRDSRPVPAVPGAGSGPGRRAARQSAALLLAPAVGQRSEPLAGGRAAELQVVVRLVVGPRRRLEPDILRPDVGRRP
ncbi:hypothetical protein FJT64_012948 [Amphibalanus amphitrite]|uniref:Uncharacterized protein n=1 Tax=Amphibalanus amphitrite TaxID=1232801 RepID=A0A6A4VE25_AMPAM|nr:hypothetical protein FJT64_012948 [Amphibalanus amphitrite]